MSMAGDSAPAGNAVVMEPGRQIWGRFGFHAIQAAANGRSGCLDAGMPSAAASIALVKAPILAVADIVRRCCACPPITRWTAQGWA